MTIATYQMGDFLKDPTRQPGWAQLTRLAGDRAAILFEELRRRVSVVDGLIEELVYQGPELGWAPHYRCGETSLFSVIIRPGVLEAAVTLDGSLRERALKSPRVARGIKQAIQSAPVEDGITDLRTQLGSLGHVRAFANIVLLKSKSASHPGSPWPASSDPQ